MLKLNWSTENVRELALQLNGAQGADDAWLEEAGDVWTAAAIGVLASNGVEYKRDYGQRVGSFVIVQEGTSEEREAWEAALNATMHLAEAHLAKLLKL